MACHSGMVAASIILLVFFMKVTPTGMVPNEDTGTIMGAVTLPPGTSQERAMEILNQCRQLGGCRTGSRFPYGDFRFRFYWWSGSFLRFYHY